MEGGRRDLDGGVIHNEGRLKGWALKSQLFWALHCEKGLFVLASRQKIPVLRTENTAVDTRTICLPPIEFFKIPHARKATAGKSRPKLQIRPENPGLLVPGGRLFTFPCLKC